MSRATSFTTSLPDLWRERSRNYAFCVTGSVQDASLYQQICEYGIESDPDLRYSSGCPLTEPNYEWPQKKEELTGANGSSFWSLLAVLSAAGCFTGPKPKSSPLS